MSVTFTPRSADRISRITQWAEKTIGTERGPSGQAMPADVVYVYVSEAVPTDGYYPAKVVSYSAESGSWITYGDCYVKVPNSIQRLYDKTRYPARFTGTTAAGLDVYTVLHSTFEPSIVNVKLPSGSVTVSYVGKYRPIALGAATYSPSTDSPKYETVTFERDSLTTTSRSFGISLVECEYPDFAYVAISGVVPAYVYINDTSHTMCGPTTSDYLGSVNSTDGTGGTSGNWIKILAKPSGTGLKLCYVYLPGPRNFFVNVYGYVPAIPGYRTYNDVETFEFGGDFAMVRQSNGYVKINLNKSAISSSSWMGF